MINIAGILLSIAAVPAGPVPEENFAAEAPALAIEPVSLPTFAHEVAANGVHRRKKSSAKSLSASNADTSYTLIGSASETVGGEAAFQARVTTRGEWSTLPEAYNWSVGDTRIPRLSFPRSDQVIFSRNLSRVEILAKMTSGVDDKVNLIASGLGMSSDGNPVNAEATVRLRIHAPAEMESQSSRLICRKVPFTPDYRLPRRNFTLAYGQRVRFVEPPIRAMRNFKTILPTRITFGPGISPRVKKYYIENSPDFIEDIGKANIIRSNPNLSLTVTGMSKGENQSYELRYFESYRLVKRRIRLYDRQGYVGDSWIEYAARNSYSIGPGLTRVFAPPRPSVKSLTGNGTP